MTKKLYWDAPKLYDFEARVLQVAGDKLVLDATAFYPTGGGQPCDLGTIDGRSVLSVEIDNEGAIFHQLTEAGPWKPGDKVRGIVDGERRCDFTRHHSGQHILSQAFFSLFGAETKGFRMSTDYAEIDLAFDCPAEEAPDRMSRAEGLANSVIFENRPIRQKVLTPDEAATLPLRKETFIEDCVRVVEVEDFDLSACGGTHAEMTGEVGGIGIKSVERAKKMYRVRFLCGSRLVEDYRLANSQLQSIADSFSVPRDDAGESINRLRAERHDLEKRLKEALSSLSVYEAKSLLAGAVATGSGRLVLEKLEGRSLDELKLLAHALVKEKDITICLASVLEETARIVIATSGGVDAGNLMKACCNGFGGKGGGTSEFSQGGVPGLRLAEVFAFVRQELK